MAAETIRIEIPVEMVDKTEPELSNIIKKISKFDQSTKRRKKVLKNGQRKSMRSFWKQKKGFHRL